MPKVDLVERLADARERVEAAETARPVPEVPLYATFVRKEALIREEQQAALTALARDLMRRRRHKAERITENTLIRIAIDLLLAHEDQLRGASEAELRKSVTPGPPNSPRPEPQESRTPGTNKSQTRGAGEPRTPIRRQSHDAVTPAPSVPQNSGVRR